MTTNEDRDRERQAWNDALASGDQARINAVRDSIMNRVVLDWLDDERVQERTHGGGKDLVQDGDLS